MSRKYADEADYNYADQQARYDQHHDQRTENTLPSVGDVMEIHGDPEHTATVRDVDLSGDEPLLLLRWDCHHKYPCERSVAQYETYAGMQVKA